MIDEAIQKRLLEKILASEEFASSKIHQQLLTYLFEATKAGRRLKETTIAMEVFGKDAHFNPAEDTTVRSHIYTLRRKLEKYYLTEGKEDRFRLQIPKGNYEVHFLPETAADLSLRRSFARRLRYAPLILSVLLAGLALGLWLHNRSLRRELASHRPIHVEDPIWFPFAHSALPVLVAVGDHFFYTEFRPEYGRTVYVRDLTINSEEDLKLFRARHPQVQVTDHREKYYPHHSIWSLPPVLTALASFQQRPLLKSASELRPANLEEYNIIFVGSIKTLGILRHTVITASDFDYEIVPHRIRYRSASSDCVRVFEAPLASEGPSEDLALILKLPGPRKNVILVVASFGSLGAPEAVKHITDPSKLALLEELLRKKCGVVPQYFELLMRISGIDKVAFDTEILVAEEIRRDRTHLGPVE
ncbi:MAG: helix-turn-helix domain-containing protein [candidate division KSB1 bacterium]|nr:helix-turn-helix domain-containing protein [candidate division KSB1 bacterium]MDZ7294534.1 helix-turn-helix domain-containing protein [candidate division KSB1 bacterium]MDZ7386188.1 helix-turn-helix domain-containing protein [candidate division KSB1 bacterium]MDZ7392417.1 helix-turn-helix domain-containing protein [candidate division KSB1 bacterium]MDZ7412262.1 helix-turn-helix domain-containing protein [candidate division KSB1 bacterium]